MAVQVELVTVAALPVKVTGGNAILANSTVSAESTGAGVLYGINKPWEGDADHYAKLFGNGSAKQWSSANVPCLANADVQATITAANSLRVVVLVNGSPITRVGSGATPSTAEFKVSGSSPILLDVGSTYAAGTKIEVLITDAADLHTASALTANTKAERTAYDICTAGTAAITLSA